MRSIDPTLNSPSYLPQEHSQQWPWDIKTLLYPSIVWNYVIVNITLQQCWKLRQFGMPGTCEKWLGRVNSCIYYVRQTQEALKSTE